MRNSENEQSFKSISLGLIIDVLRRGGLLTKITGPDDCARQLQTIVSSSVANPDSCFIMFKGTSADSHDFASKAYLQGCRVFVGDNEKKMNLVAGFSATSDVTCIHVTNSRAAWAIIAAEAAGNPQGRLLLAGVTGTNGKTSTIWLMRQLVDLAGGRMLTIGTLGLYLKNSYRETHHTSPDPDYLYPALAQGIVDGATSCGMEVSSHSLAQEKLQPVQFQFAGFTSFSRDHLDFHGSEAAYLTAKLKLFQNHINVSSRVAFHQSVVAYTSGIMPALPKDRWIYGLQNDHSTRDARPLDHWNTLFGNITGYSPSGTKVTIETRVVGESPQKVAGIVPLFGEVFIENFMSALIGAQRITGEWVAPDLWASLQPVPGRMEPVSAGTTSARVFVDYAHTPDALERVLSFCRQLLLSNPKARLWCVFGCGGDRDRGKRPLMAAICEKLADHTILTTDNPRSESPDLILTDIESGFSSRYRKSSVVPIIDRRQAIHHALDQADKEDLILIAGKGHETYQEIHGTRHPFDDRVVVQQWTSSKTNC